MLCERHKKEDWKDIGCPVCYEIQMAKMEALMVEMWRTMHQLPWWKKIFLQWVYPVLFSTIKILNKYYND